MQVPSESFSVQIEESSGTSHLHLTGWLDAAAVPALQDAVAGARPLDVALDLDGLEFIDGAGWLGVTWCDEAVAKWGGRLLIDHGLRKMLELESVTQ